MDADLYSSTVDVFKCLNTYCVPGTVIVFDELYNYSGYENHEWKAFNEFLHSRNDLDVEYLAFNQNHEQVACRLVASSQ